MIHVRFQGKSYGFNESVLDFHVSASDTEFKNELARHFDVPVNQFQFYVVDRRPNGELIVRPEAVYG